MHARLEKLQYYYTHLQASFTPQMTIVQENLSTTHVASSISDPFGSQLFLNSAQVVWIRIPKPL